MAMRMALLRSSSLALVRPKMMTRTTMPSKLSFSTMISKLSDLKSSLTLKSSTPLPTFKPPPPLPVSNKGFFQETWDTYSITAQQKRIEVAQGLFHAARRRANDPIWYGPGRIGRQFRARHAMLTMHIWFLNKRLISDTIDPHVSLLIQEELFDILWHDTISRLRAEKVYELSINKYLKQAQQITFQHLCHYDHVFTEYLEDPEKRWDEVAQLIWYHVLLQDEHANAEHVYRLTHYVEAQYDNIMKLPAEYFHEGRIAWVDMPDFNSLRDAKGKILPKIPIHPDDYLPEGWYEYLTDGGESYYWNPTAKLVSWDRPTSGDQLIVEN